VSFAELVHEVYGKPATEFIAARTSASRAAAADGDRDLAKQLSSLKKPSAAAAAVNALARADSDRIGDLTQLHDEFADAQDEGDRDALQELGARRRALIGELVGRARELVEKSGGSLSAAASDEVVATLTAAVADDTAAKAVASGCLVRALTANGFDPADIDDAVALPIAGLTAVPRSQYRERKPSRSAEDAKARAALKDAMRAATRAAADRERSDAALRRASDRRGRLQNERDELAGRLAELDETIATLAAELEELADAQEAAASAASDAEDAVDAARHRTSPKSQ
jgi:hypothetical protein